MWGDQLPLKLTLFTTKSKPARGPPFRRSAKCAILPAIPERQRSRVEATADAMLIARGFDVPVVDRSGGRS